MGLPRPSQRLEIRKRPRGWPLMYQSWNKLLFLHWTIPPEDLRPLVPAPLEIDLYDGRAWVGVTPFTIERIHPPLLPALPRVSGTHEINVRTYVHLDGVPGVWFFSLDASNPLAVWGARLGYALPYFTAAMELTTGDDGNSVHFRSRRSRSGAAPAEFDAAWTLGPELPPADPQTLDFFLIERYCLYTKSCGRLLRARIHHKPWPLREATLLRWTSTMVQAQGMPPPADAPLVHAQAAPLEVEIWPPWPVAWARAGDGRAQGVEGTQQKS